MSTEQLFVPDRIKVGFQTKSHSAKSTYTGRLAYVIYYDKKGVLRKEKSWRGWIEKDIPDVDLANDPTEGFVLNKKVGGVKESWGWNVRQEKVRVYDPRGWEFEISIPNLLFILRECDCSRGKGLEGKFVYAWEGNTLILVPVNSEEYKKSVQFTNLQDKSVKAKDLIPGASYCTKQQQILIYLGKLERFNVNVGDDYRKRSAKPTAKQHVFWQAAAAFGTNSFVFLNELKTIAVLHSDAIVPNFAELMDLYHKSVHGTKPVRLFTRKRSHPIQRDRYSHYANYWYVEESPGVYIQCSTNYDYTHPDVINSVQTHNKVRIENGVLVFEDYRHETYPTQERRNEARRTRNRRWDSYGSITQANDNGYVLDEFIPPNEERLWVELESGAKFRVGYEEIIVPERKETTDGEED